MQPGSYKPGPTQIRSGSDAAFAHIDHDGYLRSDRADRTAARDRKARRLRKKLCSKLCPIYWSNKRMLKVTKNAEQLNGINQMTVAGIIVRNDEVVGSIPRRSAISQRLTGPDFAILFHNVPIQFFFQHGHRAPHCSQKPLLMRLIFAGWALLPTEWDGGGTFNSNFHEDKRERRAFARPKSSG